MVEAAERCASLPLLAARGARVCAVKARAADRWDGPGRTGERQDFQHAVPWDPPQRLGLETLAFKQPIGR